ncbi:hypothetical protein G647_00077 [Cladophialophora carrionii CBS 160.54]|uniref:Uncharacterized protein n=1 Tax=Cladophialophora carrionii CBS 160.54 TaxID=1279043 RepID=V9DMT4_9EURO|nr:uncharacterized protein G647_00077 [Cladophialophora carrionii CBS 160.54]ETI27628.1 hypothetical protein G647_00077 [Cladophialophora carrionii CBS 160.54]
MKKVLRKPTKNAIVRGVRVPKAKITRFERRQRLKASTANRDQIRVQQEDLSRPQRQGDDHTKALEVDVTNLQQNHGVSPGARDTTIPLQQQIIEQQQQEIVKLKQELADFNVADLYLRLNKGMAQPQLHGPHG